MINTLAEVTGPLRDEAWDLYHQSFAELNRHTVQRHHGSRAEFDTTMADSTVDKYLSFTDDGKTLRGVSPYTHFMDDRNVPLISTEYFECNFPEHWPDRVFYCLWVAVHPDHRTSGAYRELVRAMYQTASEKGGVIALDLSRTNAEVRRMSYTIRALMSTMDEGVQAARLDWQEYWVYAPTNAGLPEGYLDARFHQTLGRVA